jgi:hypothetical protein
MKIIYVYTDQTYCRKTGEPCKEPDKVCPNKIRKEDMEREVSKNE